MRKIIISVSIDGKERKIVITGEGEEMEGFVEGAQEFHDLTFEELKDKMPEGSTVEIID